MLELMTQLDSRFSLDFFLIDNDPVYSREFRKTAEGYPRVTFQEPVPTRQISSRINEYDVGLFMLDPASFNYRNALPNKFFEFIQARLGVAIWPSHEMRRVTEEHAVGVVSQDFTVPSMAAALNGLTAMEVRQFKQHAAEISNLYCAEISADTIRGNVERLI